MAAITDKFTYASSGTRAEATTLTAQKAVGANSISCAALNGWPTASAVHFQLYTTQVVNGETVIVPGSQTDWKGVVSGTTITQLQLQAGTDTIYPIGTIVVALPTAAWADDLMDGILAEHNQDGTHGAITATSVKTNTIIESTANNGVTIDGLNIKDNALNTNNSVPANALATNAITLGYTQITSAFSTGSITPTQATGLTSTVTIPAGGRRVKITVFTNNLAQSTAGNQAIMSLWDGAVGTGTQISSATFTSAYNGQNFGTGTAAVAVVSPSAGSKTYNVGLNTGGGGTAYIGASTTAPAFILVETI